MLANQAGLHPLSGIGAVIINHDSGGTVLGVIRSLLEQDLPPESILVVDNKSQDGSPEQVRASFPEVRLIVLQKNTGPSGARNIGLSHVASELVLLIDDDVYLAKHALQTLIQAQQETEAVVVVPRLVYYPEADRIQSDGAQIHMTGTLRVRHADQSMNSCPAEQIQTEAFIGACLLVHRQTLIAMAGFDRDYFFYFEDLELSYRLSSLGHKIVCAAQALAYHDRGKGTPGLSYRGSGSYPRQRAYYVIRNRWLTIALHFQPRTLMILSPMLALYELALFIGTLSRGWIVEWFKASFWMLKNAAFVCARRTRWQRLRKVPDRAILSAGPLPFAPGVVQSRITQLSVGALERVLNRYWLVARRWL